VWAALTVNIITGFIMFAGDATAYVPAISFNVKILIVLTAIALTIGVRFKLPASDQTAAMPSAAKFLALISLIFWVGAILMGVEVPVLSGVG
jgi:formate-dependent nitrite reductase membrane component NrfD